MQKQLIALTRRGFVVGKQPKAIYQSRPYLNFLDDKEQSFLKSPYVRLAITNP